MKFLEKSLKIIKNIFKPNLIITIIIYNIKLDLIMNNNKKKNFLTIFKKEYLIQSNKKKYIKFVT